MADQGQNQKSANTRASMREHVNTQMDHAQTTATYNGHGQAVGAHPPTGAPHPAENGGDTAQKSAAHVPAPPAANPPAPAPSAAAPARPAPPTKMPGGGTLKNFGPATPVGGPSGVGGGSNS